MFIKRLAQCYVLNTCAIYCCFAVAVYVWCETPSVTAATLSQVDYKLLVMHVVLCFQILELGLQ